MMPGIAGIGVIGGFGVGREQLMAALLRGDRMHQPVCAGEMDVPALLADLIPLHRFISQRALRRIERLSQIALLGCCLALEDAGMAWPSRNRLGLIVATGWGPTPDRFDSDDAETPLFSPIKFANSVQNAPAAHISILLKMDGPSLTVNDHMLSFPTALLTARQWMAEDRVEAVLVGGVDEACLSHGLWHRKAAAADGCRFSESAGVCGEGSAFFLLTKDTEKAAYGRLAAIDMGRLSKNGPRLPDDAVIFLESDAEDGKDFEWLNGRRESACYRHLYGHLPIGTAFAMAVAGLSIRSGVLYGSPSCAPGGDSAAGAVAEPLGDREITCLTLGVPDTWAQVTLSPSRSVRLPSAS